MSGGDGEPCRMSNWALSGYSSAGSWVVLITVMTLIAFNRHLSQFKVRRDTALLKSISSAINLLSWGATKISTFLLDVGKSTSLVFRILEISWLSALENLCSVDSLSQLFGVEASLPGKKKQPGNQHLKTNLKKVFPKELTKNFVIGICKWHCKNGIQQIPSIYKGHRQ